MWGKDILVPTWEQAVKACKQVSEERHCEAYIFIDDVLRGMSEYKGYERLKGGGYKYRYEFREIEPNKHISAYYALK